MKELICIVCPKGCHLRVDEDNGYAVTGNGCPRGAEYGKIELTHPTRVVTSTVKCQGAAHPRCPVKTNQAIPKELIFQAMKALDGVELAGPGPCGPGGGRKRMRYRGRLCGLPGPGRAGRGVNNRRRSNGKVYPGLGSGHNQFPGHPF